MKHLPVDLPLASTIDEEEEDEAPFDDEEDAEEEEEEADDDEADLEVDELPVPRRPAGPPRYMELTQNLEHIFAAFDQHATPNIARLARETNFARSTIRYWRRQWTRYRGWRPVNRNKRTGLQSRRIFTEAQEEEIIAEIKRQFWEPKRRLSSRAFRELVLEYWRDHRQDAQQQQRFRASNRFRLAFFRRHQLTFRRPSMSRSRAVQPAIAVTCYIAAIEIAAKRYGERRVVNMDETSWRDVQSRGATIARRGQREVQIEVKGNVKAAVSAICTVAKDGHKFPPLYILRGSTPAGLERARASLSPTVPPSRITISENGWMTETVMLRYLAWLNVAVGRERIALVVDTFPAHITARVFLRAEELRIEMIQVPRGMTGLLQPLDRSVFGPLKKISERRWDEQSVQNPQKIWDHQDGAKLLEECWQDLKERTVRRGWKLDEQRPIKTNEEEEERAAETDAQDDELWRDEVGSDEDPPSDRTREARSERVRKARRRHAAWTRLPCEEVPASFHDMPLGRTADEAQSVLQERKITEKELQRQQRRADAMWERSFAFPPPEWPERMFDGS